ncbi:hypothetical protein A2U01_0040847, partial [Trifolium medium]|nr:hypothetical protein [Trifolium medium]
MARDTDCCKHNHLIRGQRKKDTIFIGWKCPPEGWIKLKILMGLIKSRWILLGAVVCYESQMVSGFKDTLKKLLLVMLCILQCG